MTQFEYLAIAFSLLYSLAALRQFGGWRERRAETEGEGTQLRALQADFAANRQRLAESHGEIDAGASWGQSGHVDPEVAEALPLTSTG